MKKEEINKKDIAIIGISCKFPQSNNPNEFWKNLVDENNLLHFYTDKELSDLGINHEMIANPNYIKVNADLENVGSFDYSFFGYTKDEANCMDPQTRTLHEQVWLAFEDAGYDISSYKEKVGVYVSMSDNLNWVIYNKINPSKNVNSYYQQQLLNKNFSHTLLSYNLDLKGPSYLIDTACSSSLSSIHIACRNLLLRECSMALAAGISIDSTKSKGYMYKEGMISSKDGYCKAFDEKSSGTIAGNGGAVIVLKRLEDAVRDRDHIYAVIKSSAVNNDGKGKVGYTAPSVIGQSECIKLAHKIANIPSNTISYIETHGTGTKLGDPIEIEALNKAFNYDTTHKCAIGSVKTNMGHLDAAAGIAGLVKTALSLKNKKIPATLHFTKPNAEINFSSGPFYVNAQLKEWKNNTEHPLRAGVSSFGIGGTNVHVVMEEAPETTKGTSLKPFHLLTYSAKTKSSVEVYQKKLQTFISQKDINISDLGYTLNTGRKGFPYRNFIVCKDKKDAVDQLQNIIDNRQPIVAQNRKNIVFMFSGQGSQYLEMGKEIYKQEPYFKAIVDNGFEILKQITGEDYKEIIGYGEKRSEYKSINDTEYTQPLLFVIEYALARLLMHWGIKPVSMIGHSLGEYTAACISEVFSFEDGIKIIAKRAKLMTQLPGGLMVSVGTAVDTISGYLNEGLSIAAKNTENTCVVSGNEKSIKAFIEILNSKNIAHSVLKTSHAFHSEMMDPILGEFKDELDTIKLSAPKYHFISNLTGKEILNDEATSSEYWVKHLRNTVNFTEGINGLVTKNADAVFIEIGPGKTLNTFCRQSKNYSGSNQTVALLRHPNEVVDDMYFLAKAMGELWSYGVNIDWNAYYSEEIHNKIAAPTYSFDIHKVLSNVDPLGKIKNNESVDFNSKRNINDWFYIPNWKKSIENQNQKGDAEPQDYLIFSNDKPLIEAIKNQLLINGNRVVNIIKGSSFHEIDNDLYSVNPDNEQDFTTLFEELKRTSFNFHHILYNWEFLSNDHESLLKAFSTSLYTYKGIINYRPDVKKKVTIISDQGNKIIGKEEISISNNALTSLAKICAQENSNISASCIDINQEENNPDLINKVINDIILDSNDFNTAYRNNSKWIEFYEKKELKTAQKNNFLMDHKTYLITGGLGSLGLNLTSYLCDNHNSKVILLGRSSLPSPESWNEYIKDKNSNSNTVAKIKKLQELNKNNQEVFYYQADVSDHAMLQEVISNIEREHGEISGVIHAAGIIEDSTFKSIEKLTQKQAIEQFSPKIKGTLNIHSIFKDRDLDFVWISSSLSSVLGGLTYGAYAFANKYIDAFVQAKNETLPNWFGVNLDGLSEGRIDAKQLIEVFLRSFEIGNQPQLIVSVKDIELLNNHIQTQNNVEESILEEHIIDRPVLNVNYEPPIDEVQKELCEIWQAFFGYKKIGIIDDFFDLGGDSLKAMTLLKHIEKTFEVEMSLKDLFAKPNIKVLSEEIQIITKMVKLQEKNTNKNIIRI